MPEPLRKPGEVETVIPPVVEDESKVVNENIEQKIKEQEEKFELENKRNREDIEKIKFDNEFKTIVEQYPYANDLKDKISEKMKSGVSLSDAAILVMNSENKLQRREDIEREEAGREGMGGSAPTMIRSGNTKVDQAVRALNNPNSRITEEELLAHQQTLRDAFIEEERKGNIRMTAD